MNNLLAQIHDPSAGVSGKKNCGLFIVACGFEARALHLWRHLPLTPTTQVVALTYSGGPIENDPTRDELVKAGNARGMVHWVTIPAHPLSTRSFDDEIVRTFENIRECISGEVWLDVSGLANWAISVVLAALLDRFPVNAIKVLYTAAKEYYPTKQEYDRYKRGKGSLRLPPPSLTYDVQSNLIPERFSGNSIDIGQTCLILFSGYESHRSQAAIEDINPARIVIVYGTPPSDALSWRTSLSKDLHASVTLPYNHAVKEVPTNDLAGGLNVILTFYKYLYEDHLLRVAPINSKIHAVSAVLAWKRFPDIQLCFPQAVRFLPERFSKGVEASFVIDMSRAWETVSQPLG